MKTSQIFIISALIISGTFFGVLYLFELPQSIMEWVISDVILGVVLYLSYLVIATISRSRARMQYSPKKVIA